MLRLLFAGDFIPPDTSANIFSEELLGVLQDKDFSIVNLETPITQSGNMIEKTGYNFKRKPSIIRHVKDGYFDAVALANNHIRDFGDEGVRDTLELCDQQNLKTVGVGKNLSEARRPLKITVEGKKITFFNYSEQEFNIATREHAGANPFDIKSSYYDISSERSKSDYIIIIYHGGLEYQNFPTLEIVQIFKFMIDVGADAVISHHTHQISGAIYYKGKPLIFGLGNFLAPTKSRLTNNWAIGLIGKLILEEGDVYFSLYPVTMNSSFNEIDLLNEEDKRDVLRKINEINLIIENDNEFENYWDTEFLKARSKILTLLKSNTYFEYKLRKGLSSIYTGRLTRFKKNILLNMVRCDSMRARLLKVLTSF